MRISITPEYQGVLPKGKIAKAALLRTLTENLLLYRKTLQIRRVCVGMGR